MLNNPVLDVAIGLIFIYMLYSLLATTVKEFIATLFSYRSRMLERGIEQMLDGRNYSYYWWDKVANWYWYLRQRPRIKATITTKTDDGQKPVEGWSQEMKAFNSRVKLNENKTDDAVKPATYIKRAKLNKKAELFAANITNHALYKRMAENSLFFKKPAYLSSDSFSDILLDILSSQKSTAPGSPVLMKDIAAFVNSSLENNPQLKKILSIYIEQANGDLQRFKLLVENWYDGTMDRVSGWYKKQATRVLLMIGFVMAITFNISSIQIIKKLSEDKTVRDAIVKNATEYVNDHIQQENKAGKDTANKKQDSTKGKRDSTQIDTTFATAKRQLDSIKNFYKQSIEENNNLLGLGWGDYGYAADSILYTTDPAAYKCKHSFWRGWMWKDVKAPDHFPRRSVTGKMTFVLSHGIFNWMNLIGFLITAFAISLGAPFWFDLLNKFINIRVSGAKPADARKGGGGSKTPGMNQPKPDPKSFA